MLDDRAALEAAWSQHGFESEPPEVTFGDEVVLLVGRPDNSCADEPVRLGMDDGWLDIEWSTPPGPCDDLLMQWVHAIQVHRGVLAEEVTFGPDEPYQDQLEETTISLPPYEGEAPPDPAPPGSISDEELEAMFAEQPLERCGPGHEPFRDEGFDFPLTEQEQARDHRVTERLEAARRALETAGWDLELDAIPVVARDARIRPVVVTHEEDAEAVSTLLDDEVGAIVSLTGPPGPVRVGMVDPTSEALAQVAETVDPGLVCVEVSLSGVRPTSDPG